MSTPRTYQLYRWNSDWPRHEIRKCATMPDYCPGTVRAIMATPILVRPPHPIPSARESFHLSVAWGKRWFLATNLNHWVCLDHLEEIKGPTRRRHLKKKAISCHQ